MLKIREVEQMVRRFSIEHLFQPEASLGSNSPPHMVSIRDLRSNDANIEVHIDTTAL
jgi:hypothetical protein